MKKKFGEYYLGFDIGTESVGWAATDLDYKILKFNGKAMWGVHLFESGETAAERRTFRTARRRTARISERLALVRNFFAEEIAKVDENFLERLQDSKFWSDDKKIEQKNALFNDAQFKDVDYHGTYPTIYHLRDELIKNPEAHDVRLVYLAVHHILKHRGHFLYEGQDFAAVTSFENVFNDLILTLNDYDMNFDYTSFADVEAVMKNRNLNVTRKKSALAAAMGVASREKSKKAMTDLLAGGKVSLSTIFDDSSLDECEITKISFGDGIDEKMDQLRDILEEKMFVIEKLKAVYDWSILVNILQGSTSISAAKVRIFEEHKSDLKILKAMCKKYLSREDKNKLLKDKHNPHGYSAYLGEYEALKGANAKDIGTQKEFCKSIIALLGKLENLTDVEIGFMERVAFEKAFPKQVTKDNGIIPYQLHLSELKAILANAEKYLPFLAVKDADGLSITDKIISILTFRIPYYVGPLNSHSDHAWIVRNEDGKIYPWNFHAKVDEQQSADKFILRMTNKCTYLPTADVLPKHSILYSRYNILNQLNNVKVDGEPLPNQIRQDIYMNLFENVEKPRKVSKLRLKQYLKSVGICENIDTVEITGIDQEIVGDMKALCDFRRILRENLPDVEVIDEIVAKIVILGESKKLLQEYLQKNYGGIFTSDEINKISQLKYTGWGNFSREFLTQICSVDMETGEVQNIIDMMFATDNNLMQLLSNKYGFLEAIEEYNEEHSEQKNGLSSKILKDLYVSPAVKRSIWRVLMLTKEIVKIAGHAPEKIFIEMARDDANEQKKNKGKRTTTRKNQLLDIYQNKGVEDQELLQALEREDEGNLRDNRLYLYYAQMGRCMYSGEKIELSQIESNYDIDHIYPQSKVKDDSITANKVLVKRQLNADKGDKYPIPAECLTPAAHDLWRVLYDKGLISKEKYSRLSCRTGFTDDQLSGFIARQLVETRQSSKAVAKILEQIYGANKVVYVKAGNVSDFRHKYGIVKSRLVNDYHHAKDAYLNVVVGNVYHEKFTKNPIAFIKSKKVYSMNKVFDYTIIKGERVVWQSENDKTLIFVKSQVAKNNIQYTRYATTTNGGYFDQMPVKKGNGQYPLKTSDPRLLNIDRYGAYNSIKSFYYCLVEHLDKKKTVRSIEYVPTYLNKTEISHDELQKYLEDVLGLKDAQILIPKIKVNTLFKVDGVKMHLSGRTGKQFTMKLAMPLLIDEHLYVYAKKIEKYIDKNREVKAVMPIGPHQKITTAMNLKLYDVLLDKLENSIYNKVQGTQVKVFTDGRDKFQTLKPSEQCELLYNAFSLFSASPSGTNLTLIGGKGQVGVIYMSANISNKKSISIIYQSVTGLFEQEVDLQKL